MLVTSLSLPEIFSVLGSRTVIWPVDLVPAHTWGGELAVATEAAWLEVQHSAFPAETARRGKTKQVGILVALREAIYIRTGGSH